jgi:hypothetical protein
VKPRIDPAAIKRSRPAGIPRDGGGEAALAFAIRAAGLPEPMTQFHFCWCCEHLKEEHSWYRGYPSAKAAKVYSCEGCPSGKGHPYSHERDFRFDFAWPAQRLAVEVDGGTYSGGRHTRGKGYEEDCEKVCEAVIRGWRVMKVTTKQVDSGEALSWIERALS